MSKFSAKEIKASQGASHWHKLKNMSDEDINKATQSDPDCKVFSDHELAQFRYKTRK